MGGGFVLGILATLASTYIDPQASDWFPFVVILVVLILAPNGIFGSGEVLKRGLLATFRHGPGRASEPVA
jgi:branched-chain amino acid transport system permease protein